VIAKLIKRLKRGAAADATSALPLSGWPPGAPAGWIDALSDADLERFNELLPWSAFVVDGRGRRVGRTHSSSKRSQPQTLPDARIVELDRRYSLRDKKVLEIGCFEGIHTIALAQRAASVTAIDSRIENVLKTIVRCAMYGTQPLVFVCDVETDIQPDALRCDVLHHVGVLYHLADPVAHLRRALDLTRVAVLLDTHVAPAGGASERYVSAGRSYDYFRYAEGGRNEPFSGMYDHAKWLPEETLIELLREAGFANAEVFERRAERNGPRVCIYASR
jgi:SAM-dependent methyltransferase